MFFRTHWWNGKQKVLWFLLSWSVVSDFLHPHGLQDTGFPCSLLSPEVCSTSCSLSHSMPSNHLILCHPLLLLASIFPSIRVFTNESAVPIRWPKYWSFSISPSYECSGFSAFRSEWFDNPAVQKTLKSLLQHRSSKPSILQHSAFFMVQLSHPYVTTGRTTALTIWAFVGKVMSPLFNMLSRLILALLSRSRCLLISWLQSPSAVALETKKIKSHCFQFFLMYLP